MLQLQQRFNKGNMSIKLKLTEDMKQAMRDRDRLKLDTIRFLLAEIKNTEIDQGELSDDSILQLISRQIKQIKETLADYEKAGNTEVVTEEEAKVAVLEDYLPAQLSDEELKTVIDEVKSSMPDANVGQIIGAVKAKAGASADGGRIASLVRS